ncbi:hypothetical protein PUN28_013735 [Cardiocondyla obscurior]|uniref:Uncharacterized protein n=1 Tax=Cardiocondyla obscurior TaxID=286306 RepID=A0AAW2F303_9HYME
MDDININKICLDIEELELDGEDKDWIKLNWINSQIDDNANCHLPEDLEDDVTGIRDCDNKVLSTNMESEDISDGISVITESDADIININQIQICTFESIKSPQMLKEQISRQKDVWHILTACGLGIIIGLALSYVFTTTKTCPVSSEIDAESLKTASHNILNTCKELTNVKTMLNEIKGHIPTDKKVTKEFLTHIFNIADFSNEANNKPDIIIEKFINSTSHSMDQLQGSLHVLSSLASLSDNSSLKSDINKTLDIVSNTKIFYDTLTATNTGSSNNLIALNILQHNNDKMHIISKSLLSNLIEKISKVMAKIYNKYVKETYKLKKLLCYLKNTLPDDKILQELTKDNSLFKEYDKSCIMNHTLENLDNRTTTKIHKEKIKEQNVKTDDTILHAKNNKKDNHRVYDNNKKMSLKNKRNKKESDDKSTMKFLRRTSHKIYNDSQLVLSEVIENISKLKHQLNKLHHLKDIIPNNSEFLKQVIKDNEEDNKDFIKSSKGKDDLKSNTIPKNNFDNILMQLKNTCPFSTDYCPKFDINMSTFNTEPNHKSKNYKHKKYSNSKKTTDGENSAKILPEKKEKKPKKKDYFKSNNLPKKVKNDRVNYEGNSISRHEDKVLVPEHTDNYYKFNPSFNSRTMKQENQYNKNTDQRSNSRSSYECVKQWQLDDSDWYFRRAFARRNARRHAEYMYSKISKWKNH